MPVTLQRTENRLSYFTVMYQNTTILWQGLGKTKHFTNYLLIFYYYRLRKPGPFLILSILKYINISDDLFWFSIFRGHKETFKQLGLFDMIKDEIKMLELWEYKIIFIEMSCSI